MLEASSYLRRNEVGAHTPPGFMEKGEPSQRSHSGCPIGLIADLAGKPQVRPVSIVIPDPGRQADPQFRAGFERMKIDALAF